MGKLGTAWVGWAIALALATFGGGNALALTDEEILRDFRFNFVNPGGRALGLGGAFIAAGDDATAAEANPAALHYVDRIQIFGEYRVLQTDRFRSTSQAGSDALGSTQLPFLELEAATVTEDAEIPSFVSFVLPFRMGRTRAALALSRQVVLDVSSKLENTDLEFASINLPWVNPTPDGGGGPAVEQYTVGNRSTGGLDAQLVHYNLGFSLSLGNDFSIGLTGTMADLDLQSNLQNVARDPLGFLSTDNPRVDLDGNNQLDDILTTSTINDTDSAFAYTLGLHYHPDSKFERGYSPVRFGMVYRKGAELNVPQVIEQDPGGSSTFDRFDNTVRVPDRFGVGVSGELGRNWVVALDLERIEYSDLLENFKSEKNFFTSGLVDGVTLNQIPNKEIVYDVDDATIVHLGAEYTIRTRGSSYYALRGGYFNAPDNRIRMTEFNAAPPAPGDVDINQVFEQAFAGGEDENHFTFGISMTTLQNKLTIDLAGDVSDSENQFLISTIWRIGKVRR